jgi:hypothetical protein
MSTLRLALLAVLAVLIALLAGWIWGNAGRRAAEAKLEAVQSQQRLAEARAHLLEARVDLFEVNFGDASRALEAAKRPLREAADRFQRDRQDEAAQRVREALAAADQAQQLAAKLDQGANTRAAAAVQALDDVGRAMPAGR